MSRRNVPAKDREIANPATGETSQEIWHRWSVDRINRERQERLKTEAEAQALTERGIYPIEIARAIALGAAQGTCPEWRYLKDLIAEDFGRILKRQPEMRQRDVHAREQIIVALFNGLPKHLHGALSELRTVLELVSTAREASAFLVGYEVGRESGRRDAFRDPRVTLAPARTTRKALPGAVDRAPSGPLRLTLADTETE